MPNNSEEFSPDFRERALIREKYPDEADFLAAVERMKAGEPLGYVLGEWYFYGLTFLLNRDCLIPRPETEHLVEYLIGNLPKNAFFLDLCTGSGCIAISVLKHRPDCTALAADLSEGALEMAKKNAAMNGVSERITFVRADILNDIVLPGDTDAIASNPPYIRKDVIPTLSEQVRREPVLALDGGEDGLIFYRRLVNDYLPNMKKGAFLAVEIGYDQGDAMRALGCDAVYRDYSGNDRVAVFQK